MLTHRVCCCAALAGVLLASVSIADEVVFKNGDRVTGKLDGLDGTKLTIDKTVGGKVTVDLKDVKTFSSDGPIDLVLKNGTALHEKVNSGPDGQIALAAPAGGAGQAVSLTDLKKINPPPVRWTGALTVGGILARGNTNTDQFNAALNLVRKTDQDKITLDAGYIYGREHIRGLPGKHETANDLFGGGEYDYYFTPKFYGYANIRAEHDTIAGLDLRLTPGVGVGYQWVDSPNLSFSTEGGAGVIYRKYAHDGDSTTASARAAYHLTGKFNDKLSFFHNFEYLPGLDRLSDYYFHTDAGIHASITEKMFTEFKIDYRYDSMPAPGKEHNDIRYILGVGWTF